MGLYGGLERKLEGSDNVTKGILVTIAVIALFAAFLQPSRTFRVAAAAWFVLP